MCVTHESVVCVCVFEIGFTSLDRPQVAGPSIGHKPALSM